MVSSGVEGERVRLRWMNERLVRMDSGALQWLLIDERPGLVSG
jgi:hypothetical protein